MDEEILERLARHLPSLREEFGITRLAVFGSVARGEEGPESDVDLLVEFAAPPGLFAFVRLKHRLEALLDRPVDLVTPGALREEFREQILRECVDAG